MTASYLHTSHEHIAPPLRLEVTTVSGTTKVAPDPSKVTFAVVPFGAPVPTAFPDTAYLNGVPGVWSGPRGIGLWDVYAHIVDTPEIVDHPCGSFRTT